MENSGIGLEERAGDSGVPHVELGTFHESAQPIRMPRRQSFEQEDGSRTVTYS